MKRLIFIFLFFIISINFISAYGDLDNVKSYDVVKREVTFKDSFIDIPTTLIGTAKLNTPNVMLVPRGKNVLVAEYQINLNYDSYKNALGKIEFYDIKKNNLSIDRNFTYKKKVVEQKEVIDYESVCPEKADFAGKCDFKEVGKHLEDVIRWEDYNIKDLEKGIITLGIFTDVESGDLIEWKPYLFGLIVPEWAVWQDSFNVGLYSYYTFNSSAGTSALDSIAGRNLTVGGNYWESGIIGKSYVANGSEHKAFSYKLGDLDGGNDEFSVSFWIYRNGTMSGAKCISNCGTGGASANGMWEIYCETNYLGSYMHDGTLSDSGAVPIPLNIWTYVTYVYNGTVGQVYMNGTKVGSAQNRPNFDADATATTLWAFGRDNNVNLANLKMDELSFYNRSLSDSEILNLYNNGSALTYDPLNVAITPILFNAQIPNDLNTINVFGNVLNISYNFTNTGNINISQANLFYKVNSSLSNCFSIINYSYYSCDYQKKNALYNISGVYYFRLSDNEVYNGLYNFNQQDMESSIKLNYSLSTQSSAFNINIRNVSNNISYGIYEIYAKNQTSTTQPLNIYYCNSSYNSGDFKISGNCLLFHQIKSSDLYNHTHGINSFHYIIPFIVNNLTGKIGSVVVTENSNFIINPYSSVGGWDLEYINNVSRSGVSYSSFNSGLTWSNQLVTIDSHLHQYTGSETLYYFASNNSLLNSSISFDNLQLGGIPSSTPLVYNPINSYYTGNISINYTSAVSPQGYNISFYNISLRNLDGSYNLSITGNNLINLSYIWNSANIKEGNYLIGVQAFDINNLSGSLGLSNGFILDQNKPNASLGLPLSNFNITDKTYNFVANFSDNYMLYNSSLIVWNSTNSKVIFSTQSLSGNFSSASFAVSLPDGNYTYAYLVYDFVGYSFLSSNRSFTVDLPPINGNLNLIVNQYPYIDLNVSYPMNVYFSGIGSTSLINTNVYINITAVNSSNVFSFVYNPLTSHFDLTLLFADYGDYTFKIWEDNLKITTSNLTGVLKVRTPFNITVQVFDSDDSFNPYINNFAYITAEFDKPYNSQFDALENFIYPLSNSKSPVFHTKYTGGIANLKLFENETNYMFRIIDGDINFNYTYSSPDIKKTYKINSYLGKKYINSTNQNINFVISQNQIHQYRTFINWIMILGILLISVVSIVLFFAFPQMPLFALIFGFLFTFLLVATRLIIWWFTSW
jgi:hypothetical protein